MKSLALTLASLAAADTCMPVTWTSTVNVAASPGILERASPPSDRAWSAGAISTEELSSSAQSQSVSFKCGTGANAMAGLGNTNTGVSYQEIAFVVNCAADGTLYVYEHGDLKTTAYPNGPPYTPSSELKIQVTGTTVQYLNDDVVFYTSANSAAFPLHVDTSLHGGGSPSAPTESKLSDVTLCRVPVCAAGYARAGHTHHDDRRRRLSQADETAGCAPCVAGTDFSTEPNSPTCTPVTPCAVGSRLSAAGTTTADQQCSACTNAPAHSEYTGSGSGGTTSDCLFRCSTGFTLTNGGTTCSDDELRATLKFDDRADIHVYDNNVMQIETGAGGCVDAPAFCSGSWVSTRDDIKTMKAEVAALKAFLFVNDGYSP